MNLYFIFLLISSVLFSCSKETTLPVTGKTLSGKVILINSMDKDIIENQSTTIQLFNYGSEFSEISEIKTEYSFIGANFDEGMFYDHRLLGVAYKEATTDTEGNFEVEDIAEGNYILIYSADGFGWHKQIVNVFDDLYITLSMRETISAETSFNGNLTWGPNQHILVGDDFLVPVNCSLTILENTVIELNSSNITVVGDLIVNGDKHNPIIFTSNENIPSKGDWEGLKFFTNNTILSNCIFQWADIAIDNHGKFEATNVAFLNCLEYGVIFNSYSSNIYNSILFDCHNGVYASWTKMDSIDILINKSIIINNDFYGLKFYESSPNMFSCYLKSNGIHINSEYNSYPFIEHCYFGSTTDNALYSAKEYDYNGNLTIKRCIFENNNTIIRCNRSADIIAFENNFDTTGDYIFQLTYYFGGNTVNAQNNWWSTSDENAIQDLIWDEIDEPGGYNSGTVDYSNWKNNKVAAAGPIND